MGRLFLLVELVGTTENVMLDLAKVSSVMTREETASKMPKQCKVVMDNGSEYFVAEKADLIIREMNAEWRKRQKGK